MVRTEVYEDQPLTEARPFKYEKPKMIEKGKKHFRLARSDILYAGVQVLHEGGENNLHSHSALDGFWMVLSGRVRFYGEDDVLLGDFGQYEGILIPRHCKYWFESVGPDPLELLQVEALTLGQKVDRVDHAPRKP